MATLRRAGVGLPTSEAAQDGQTPLALIRTHALSLQERVCSKVSPIQLKLVGNVFGVAA